jgi:hypothetical protein
MESPLTLLAFNGRACMSDRVGREDSEEKYQKLEHQEYFWVNQKVPQM